MGGNGLHLNNDGKEILANNFMYVLNRFILWNEKIYNGTSKNDFYSKQIETGLSDFHKMIFTVMKTSYQKIELRVLNYRHYESFSNERFRESLLENLKEKLLKNSNKSFRNFINSCNSELDIQLPKKINSMLEVINCLLWIKLYLKQLF